MDQTFWRAVGADLWPALQGAGFTSGLRDRVWREKLDRRDVIQIVPIRLGALYPELRRAMGCAIEVGVVFRAIPSLPGPEGDEESPGTPACHIRSRLDRIDSERLRMADIWHVGSNHSNLSLVIAEMQRLLLSEGLAWFERFASAHDVLHLMLHENTAEVVMGSGRMGSPVRNYVAGFLALSLGEYDHAEQYLGAAQEQWDDVPSVHRTITDALDRIRPDSSLRKNTSLP